MLDKFRSTLRGGLTVGRIGRAIARRVLAIPHGIAYKLHAGPGSTNHERLTSYSGRHRGERAFILGNGPSLAETDLSRISEEYTFGLNRIFLLFDRSSFRPSYYVCMNGLVLDQSADEILDLTIPRFVNWNRRALFGQPAQVAYLREVFAPRFSSDLTEGVWGGATVTFVALQIAYYMGFEQVVLIGVDHEYSRAGTPHSTVAGESEDPDHFHPHYFPEGFRWQLPDLSTSEYAYELARRTYEADGRSVVDATIGGKLEVFPKVDYESVTR